MANMIPGISYIFLNILIIFHFNASSYREKLCLLARKSLNFVKPTNICCVPKRLKCPRPPRFRLHVNKRDLDTSGKTFCVLYAMRSVTFHILTVSKRLEKLLTRLYIKFIIDETKLVLKFIVNTKLLYNFKGINNG